MDGEMNATETVCRCGAIGRVAPPEEQRGDALMIEWRGGNVGEGRVALERWTRGATTCPGCQHRACVYVVSRCARGPDASVRAPGHDFGDVVVLPDPDRTARERSYARTSSAFGSAEPASPTSGTESAPFALAATRWPPQ
jgi:hypothetical protein